MVPTRVGCYKTANLPSPHELAFSVRPTCDVSLDLTLFAKTPSTVSQYQGHDLEFLEF